MANPSRLRRRWKVLGGLLLVAVVALAFLPTILSSSLARPRIAAGLNQAVSPGRLEFDSIELSWFAPTRLQKVQLLDPKGKVVARVPVAVLDKSLAQLILPGQTSFVLSLGETKLEVQRSEDGLIDLAEALKTIIANPNPLRDVTIRIDHGSLVYQDPFLAQPSTADSLDLVLRIPTAPNPVTWSLKLVRGDSGLEIQGDFDRWLSKGGTPKAPELQLGVVGKSWPFVAKVAEVDAQGRLDGTLDFARKRGKWNLSGDARLNGLRARGKPFAEDTLAIDKLEAGWDLLEGESGWTIRRLGLQSSLGDLKAEGQLNGPNATGHQKIEAKVDLAAIARQLPHALKLRDGLSVERGSARVVVDLDSGIDQSTYDIEARLSDLLAKDHDRNLTLREPATLNGRVIRNGKDSRVEKLALKTSFLDLNAKGRFEDGVGIQGELDLDGLRRQLSDWVDLGRLEMSGHVNIYVGYSVYSAGSLLGHLVHIGDAHDTPFTGGPQPLKTSTFISAIRLNCRDLKIDGLGIGPIHRNFTKLDLEANGPVDTAGFPTDWNAARLQFRDEHSVATIRFDSAGEKTKFTSRLMAPAFPSESTEPTKLDINGDWSAKDRILTLGEIILRSAGRTRPAVVENLRNAAPPKPKPAERSAQRTLLAAQGRLDLESGELVLTSDPNKNTSALRITSDGMHVSGIGKGLPALRFEGALTGDAAELDPVVADLMGRSPVGISGQLWALANIRGDGDGVQMSVKVNLVESGMKSPRPTSLALNARYSPKVDRLDVSEFAVTTTYGTLDASGQLHEPMGARRIDLSGKLAPDFAAITALLVQKVEPGAKVEGRPREFRASGSLGDSSGGWKGLDAEFGFEILAADIYGMKFGASPVVLRSKNGKLSFDPISTSINEGHLRLEPELDLDATGGPLLRLAKNSTIREAKINDEVSKRVLAYVAPILDQATRASGLVSVDLDHAEFPLGAGRGRQMKVEGAVVFQDVEFAPGPLAGEILGAIGRRDLTLKLDQPVTLTIADGRINQRGMAVPLGDLTRIELSGWVDFDRNLSLVASLPVTPAMLGNNPLLSDIASGTKVRLPIGGTLDNPKVDREAFSNNLQELGKTLLTRGVTRGALELLMRLGRPKDPDAPPPPPRMTPQERKAQRQEKKAIRRGEVPPPDPAAPRA